MISFTKKLNPKSAVLIRMYCTYMPAYMRDQNVFTAVLADGLTANRARSSTGTLLTEKSDMCFHFLSEYQWLRVTIVITVTSEWAWRLKSPASRFFIQPFIQGADQRRSQSCASQAFVRVIHRWPVNRTKGQWRGKCFHLMTPSWWVTSFKMTGEISRNRAALRVLTFNEAANALF